MEDEQEATKEVREIMRGKGLIPNIDLLRRTKGYWKFAILTNDDTYEWFHICQASTHVEEYLRARDKLSGESE